MRWRYTPPHQETDMLKLIRFVAILSALALGCTLAAHPPFGAQTRL